jgi:hypothetical protein
MQARGKPYARQARAPAAEDRAGELAGSTGAAATARYARTRSANPSRPAAGGRLARPGEDRAANQVRAGVTALRCSGGFSRVPAAAGGDAVLPADAACACCSGTSSSAARPAAPVCFFPVLLQHGGAAGGRALHRLPGMPVWAACCTTSCCTAALHRLVGRARSVPGTPVAADRASGYVPRPEEPEEQLVFEEFAVPASHQRPAPGPGTAGGGGAPRRRSADRSACVVVSRSG